MPSRLATFRSLPIFVFLTLALSAGAPRAEERAGERFLRLVDEAVSRGDISQETALLNKFSYVFEPAAVDPRFQVENPTPLKCATDFVREYLDMRGSLSPETVSRIEGYLAQSGSGAPPSPLSALFISPDGLFRLTYVTSGSNAVPLDDVNPPNGVPDFVEWCADYCDSSWNREVNKLGFMAPLVTDYYDIGFQQMGAYGFCQTNGLGGTRIVLHRSFLGFPPNGDPDGDQKGAAKATIAHEFKHATQYQGSFWSEGGWVELDATWCEDAVFDSTNDYYNFIQSGNSITAPQTSLDGGGAGSYEDCIWQEYMSQTYGNGIIRDLWERRKTHQSENMKTSYDSILVSRGSTMSDGYEEFMQWCYLSGARATTDLPGFGEAPAYPNSPVVQTGFALPWIYNGSVTHLAGNFFRVVNGGAFTGMPRLTFNGTVGAPLQVHVIYHRVDGSESRQEIPLNESTSADVILSHAWQDLSVLGIVVVNPLKTGNFIAYSITVNQESQTAVDQPASGASAPFALEPNAPNPANPTTTIRYRLGEARPVRLEVFDAGGRLVATLANGAVQGPGEHAILWDGRNSAGRDVAAGVYAYRMIAGPFSETRKLLLVR